MLTGKELFLAVVLPVIVSALIAALGLWRRWTWAMPLAAGLGFFASYLATLADNHFSAASQIPGAARDWRFWPTLPPNSGFDWLFWAAIPLIVLGVVDSLIGKRWGYLLGAFAAAVAYVTLHPLIAPQNISPAMLWTMAAIAGAATITIALLAGIAQERIGSLWVIMSLCVVTLGVGVVIFSSDARTSGLYGMAAAAALGPVAALGLRMKAAQSAALIAMPIVADLLMIGHYYADPGVSWKNFIVLLCAPLLMMVGAFLPLKRQWMRGIISLLAVTIMVGAVTGPTALAAKEAAEKNKSAGDDPYEKLYK